MSLDQISKTKKVAVYGIGSFGYAVLKHLDRKQDGSFTLTAFDHDQELIQKLTETRQHTFMHPDVQVSDLPQFVSTPEALLADCDIVVLAVSSDSTREVMQNIRRYARQPLTIVNCAKALDNQTGQRLSEIASEELQDFDYIYALLAGGTIADDLFRHEPLGIDIACPDAKICQELAELFESDNLHVYPTDDLLGVEYASAFKNIVSILAGIVKGLGFSYGAETHVISRTAQLIGEACVEQLGAQAETFSLGRQSWGNDLWMSCTGNTRNREFGILLGQGLPVDKALDTMRQKRKLVEGVNTLSILEHIDSVRDIEAIKLLYDLVIGRSITIDKVRDYLLRTHLS